VVVIWYGCLVTLAVKGYVYDNGCLGLEVCGSSEGWSKKSNRVAFCWSFSSSAVKRFKAVWLSVQYSKESIRAVG